MEENVGGENMNCECFYVVKDQTIEGCREFVKTITEVAEDQMEEVYPVYICKCIKDFVATSDYDNWKADFKVKKGTWLVFAQGKDYCMYRIRPKGGRRGFPNRIIDEQRDFYDEFYEYIEDVEEVE